MNRSGSFYNRWRFCAVCGEVVKIEDAGGDLKKCP